MVRGHIFLSKRNKNTATMFKKLRCKNTSRINWYGETYVHLVLRFITLATYSIYFHKNKNSVKMKNTFAPDLCLPT